MGSSPYKFKNIVMVPPQDTKSLIELLNQNDIFLTASKNDSCSNAVLEALAVGLPVVALKSGGTPEIVGEAGCYFTCCSELIGALRTVSENINLFQERIEPRTIEDVAPDYLLFFDEIIRKLDAPKKLTFTNYIKLKSILYVIRIKSIGCAVSKRFVNQMKI